METEKLILFHAKASALLSYFDYCDKIVTQASARQDELAQRAKKKVPPSRRTSIASKSSSRSGAKSSSKWTSIIQEKFDASSSSSSSSESDESDAGDVNDEEYLMKHQVKKAATFKIFISEFNARGGLIEEVKTYGE